MQPTIHDAHAQLTVVAPQFEKRWSKQAARVLRDADADMMTHLHYSAVPQQRIRTTNMVERLKVSIPDQESASRLISSVLTADDDEWHTRRGDFTERSMREIEVTTLSYGAHVNDH